MNELSKAVALAKSGDKNSAYQMLSQIVKEQPDDETAWAWLAYCAPTRETKRSALEVVLQINPQNQGAQRALKGLNRSKSQPSDSQLLDRQIAKMTKRGWLVVNRSGSLVQMRRPKQWNRGLLILGLATLCAVIGIVPLFLAVIDFLFKRDLVTTFTAEDVRRGTVTIPSSWSGPLKLAAVLLMLLIMSLIFSLVILPAVLEIM